MRKVFFLIEFVGLVGLFLLASCGKGGGGVNPDEAFVLDGKLVDGKPTLHVEVKRKPGSAAITANAKSAVSVAIGVLDEK